MRDRHSGRDFSSKPQGWKHLISVKKIIKYNNMMKINKLAKLIAIFAPINANFIKTLYHFLKIVMKLADPVLHGFSVTG